MICKQQQGYILKAIKEGYPKVNGKSIKGQTILSPGDVIEAGKTKMLFLLK
ncbi:MAG: hypothetical protein QME68_00610 [Elusimicrobiota bacterium]|nr:hypothetical protein [Elusimicrobiota bacterium]